MKVVLFIVIFLHPLLGRAQNASAIAKQYWNSVVMIVAQDANRQNLALGSGLIVENGKVVTNYHVIEGAKFAYVLSASGSKHSIDGAFATDQKNDLAVLSVPGLLKSSIILSRDSIQIGQRIYAIGNPEGLSNSISEGIVSGRRTLGGSPLIQITSPISPGSSGGPIVDDRGQVVGIAVGAITSGQNLNFAIPVSLLFPMLSKSTLSALNFPVRKTTSVASSNTTNIVDGVRVVDVRYPCWDDPESAFPCMMIGISINNTLEYTIRKVRVILILYSSSGLPLDYVEKTLCEEEVQDSDSYDICDDGEAVEIKPGLSKYFDFERISNDHRAFQKTHSEKLVTRILDFEVVRD